MPLVFPMGFELSVQEPIDSRLLMTVAQMGEAAKAMFPAYYMTICADGTDAGKIFIFDSTIPKSEKDPVYGYFRPLEVSDVTIATDWNTLSDATVPSTRLTKASLDAKVDAEAGKGLSTNDYTAAEKDKLAGIEDGAQRNVNADWDAESGDARILNRPDLSQFITNAVSDLVNYYTKADTDTMLADVLRLSVVSVLPATGEAYTLYLKVSDSPAGSVYEEYLYLNGAWVLIGTTSAAVTIVQGPDGISINGTDLQNATSSQDGLMSKEAFGKLDTVEEGAQVNVIESVKVDGVPQEVTEKSVNVDLSGYTSKALSVGIWDPVLTYMNDSVVVMDAVLYASLGDGNTGNRPDEEGSIWWKEVTGSGGGGGGAAKGVTVIFGNTTDTEYRIVHNLQSYNFLYSIRTTDEDRRYVNADVFATTANVATVRLAEVPSEDNGYLINLVDVKTSGTDDGVVVTRVLTPSSGWAYDENQTGQAMFIQTFGSSEGRQEMFGEVTQNGGEAFNPVRVAFSSNVSGYMVLKAADHYYEFADQSHLEYTPNGAGEKYYGVQVVLATDNGDMVIPDIAQVDGTIIIDFNGIPRTGYVVVVEPKMVVACEGTIWRLEHNLNRLVGIQTYVSGGGLAVTSVFNVDENECYADFGSRSVSGYLIVI